MGRVGITQRLLRKDRYFKGCIAPVSLVGGIKPKPKVLEPGPWFGEPTVPSWWQTMLRYLGLSRPQK